MSDLFSRTHMEWAKVTDKSARNPAYNCVHGSAYLCRTLLLRAPYIPLCVLPPYLNPYLLVWLTEISSKQEELVVDDTNRESSLALPIISVSDRRSKIVLAVVRLGSAAATSGEMCV